MIKIEYIGHCPYCNKQIIGKEEYATQLFEETTRAIDALNAGLADLKSIRQNYELVFNKSFFYNVSYFALHNNFGL